MAGAIAGTALINYAPSVTDKLETITLTINNLCNLKCPHCYLQYKQESHKYISDLTIRSLSEANFRHLVIVGKEPLVDNKSIEIIKNILATIGKDVSVGIITNGHGIRRLDEEFLNRVVYIDVSFDGGPKTYGDYRKSSFFNIIDSLKVQQKDGFNSFNALHVLNDSTINNLDDMLNVGEYFDFSKIMFSPYIETLNDGKNTVNKLAIETILKALANNKRFIDTDKAFLLLDIYHLFGDNRADWELLKILIKNLHLSKKVKLIEKDPIEHGFIRLTYEGMILTPYESLHPLKYKNSQLNIKDAKLNEAFERLYRIHSNITLHAN